MSSFPPGSFIIAARANVKNAHPVAGKPRSMVLDTVLFCDPPDGGSHEIPCSLRYFKVVDTLILSDGFYDVVATVTSSFLCRRALHLHMFVWNFRSYHFVQT